MKSLYHFFMVAPLVLLVCLAAGESRGSAAPQSRTAASSKSLFDHNLVQNGNAEAVTEDVRKVPGWGQKEGFEMAAYGSVGGEWDSDLSGCAGCGKQYLRLAFEGTAHDLAISQTIDVSSAAAAIDQQIVTAKASAYMGGFHDSDTTSQVVVSFQDGAGKELGTMATAACDTKQLPKAERGSTGLALYQTDHSVPSGTRKIVYTWKASATGDSGSYVALGDNFSLVLAQIPPRQH